MGRLFIYFPHSLARWLVLLMAPDYLFTFLARSVAGSCWAHGTILYLLLLLGHSLARAAHDIRLFIYFSCSAAGSLGFYLTYPFFIYFSCSDACSLAFPTIPAFFIYFSRSRAGSPCLDLAFILYLSFLLGRCPVHSRAPVSFFIYLYYFQPS